MNNNNRNNNNNRRRGRGNNNRPNGGQQINRIDSRARGNAPQMLEKYRKLALDSHMNGDRVNEEYYLQFADHYFRVIADTRVRQEESRVRRDDRWQDGDASGEREREFDYAEDAADPYEDMRQGGDMRQGADARQGGERPSSERPTSERPSPERQGERQERYGRADGQDRSERPDRFERQDRPDRDRGQRAERQDRTERLPLSDQPGPVAASEESSAASEVASQEADGRSVYEPVENPFVRGGRGEGRGLKQRRPRRAATDEAASVDAASERAEPAILEEPSVLDIFDPAILPPAVAPRADTESESADVEPEEAPKPRRRTRRPRVTDGSDEALQATN